MSDRVEKATEFVASWRRAPLGAWSASSVDNALRYIEEQAEYIAALEGERAEGIDLQDALRHSLHSNRVANCCFCVMEENAALKRRIAELELAITRLRQHSHGGRGRRPCTICQVLAALDGKEPT